MRILLTDEEKRFRKAEISRKYRAANREVLLAKKKEYRENNKEMIANSKKAYHESCKDGLFTVYYLKEDHYVGYTANLKQRLSKHRYGHGRHILDVEVLAKFNTKEEALSYESKLHSMGYLGLNIRVK